MDICQYVCIHPLTNTPTFTNKYLFELKLLLFHFNNSGYSSIQFALCIYLMVEAILVVKEMFSIGFVFILKNSICRHLVNMNFVI